MEGIVELRANERFEDFVRLLARGLLRNPAQPLGHANYVRVHAKPVISYPTYKRLVELIKTAEQLTEAVDTSVEGMRQYN